MFFFYEKKLWLQKNITRDIFLHWIQLETANHVHHKPLTFHLHWSLSRLVAFLWAKIMPHWKRLGGWLSDILNCFSLFSDFSYTCTTAKKTKKSSTKEKEKQKEINAQHDELVISTILNTSASPGPVQKSVVSQHPHFGGKQPKQHLQPPKCISVICREEKETLKMELADAVKELADTKEELSECLVLKYSSLVVNCIVCAKLSLTVGATHIKIRNANVFPAH